MEESFWRNNMFDSNYRIEISLLIYGYKQVVIDECLGITPTIYWSKGTQLSKVIPPISDDLWIYTKKYGEGCLQDEMIIDFFHACALDADKVTLLNKDGRCCVRISIQSDYAQMGISLSPIVLRIFSLLGIEVEFSVFSLGGVLD